MERMLRQPAFALACAAGIAGLAFVLVSARALPLLGGIIATLAIGCVGPWITVYGARVTIAWGVRRCRVGDTLRATITRRSLLPGRRPRLSVRWPDAEDGTRPGVEDTVTSAVPADGSPDQVVVVPRRRGWFPRPAPAVESCQPFGVVRARRVIALTEEVIVWPAPARVRVPACLVATAGSGHELSERVSGHAADSSGARDYRVGDPMRSIHWAHTARRDTLIVRERVGAAAAVVRLIVDQRLHDRGPILRRGAGADAEHRGLLDALVGIAFAIVESWGPRGVCFELAWPGRVPLLPRTAADLTVALDELACLEPLPVDVAPVLPGQRRRPVNLELLLTTPTGRESLAAAVGVAGHARHQRVWVIVGGESSAPGSRGGGGPEVVVQVPLEPDPIAAVDAVFATLGHDPDARPRGQGIRARRSHALS
jgi:uncharacterized protein (DUF58 family)